jgi:hypothetical protein
MLDVPATPDRPVGALPSLRAQVADRVAAVAPHLPATRASNSSPTACASSRAGGPTA